MFVSVFKYTVVEWWEAVVTHIAESLICLVEIIHCVILVSVARLLHDEDVAHLAGVGGRWHQGHYLVVVSCMERERER